MVCQTVLERDPAVKLFMSCFVKLSSALYVIEMYHLYVFGCRSGRQVFVCCCVSPELQVRGCAFDLLRFFPQFIWLSAFVCDPHYNPEIKYTSKQLKLNKIKCAARHRRYMLIEHIYICLLIYRSITNFPLHLSECPQLFMQSCSLKNAPIQSLQTQSRCYFDVFFMCSKCSSDRHLY